jgi:hypothetical protein
MLSATAVLSIHVHSRKLLVIMCFYYVFHSQTPEQELTLFKVLDSPTVAPWHSARLFEYLSKYQPAKYCYAVPYQKATAAITTTDSVTQQVGSSDSAAASIGALNVITEETNSDSSNTSSSSSSSSTNDNNNGSPKSSDAQQQQQQQQQQQVEGYTKLQWLALWQVRNSM